MLAHSQGCGSRCPPAVAGRSSVRPRASVAPESRSVRPRALRRRWCHQRKPLSRHVLFRHDEYVTQRFPLLLGALGSAPSGRKRAPRGLPEWCLQGGDGRYRWTGGQRQRSRQGSESERGRLGRVTLPSFLRFHLCRSASSTCLMAPAHVCSCAARQHDNSKWNERAPLFPCRLACTRHAPRRQASSAHLHSRCVRATFSTTQLIRRCTQHTSIILQCLGGGGGSAIRGEKYDRSGIWTHACEHTSTRNKRLRLLGHPCGDEQGFAITSWSCS